MKILIMTMTSGEGHNSFARAIAEECARRGHEWEVWDIFSTKPNAHALNDKGYVLLTKYFRAPYSAVWEYQIKRSPDRWTTGIFVQSLKTLKKDVLKKLEDSRPDVVICTHYYAADAMSLLAHEGKTDVPFYFVLTDYFTYPNVEVAKMAQKIFVPTLHAVDGVLAQGFTLDHVVVTGGLPVKSDFVRCEDKTQARAKLGLEDKFTVLVFAGSAGERPACAVLKSIRKQFGSDVNLVFIAGRNKKERAKVERKVATGVLADVRVEGFVNNMHEFMAAADLVVCKASGSSLAECAKMGIPVVIRENMIINEKRNAQVLCGNGAAVVLDKASDAGPVLNSLLARVDGLSELSRGISSFAGDTTTDVILDTVERDFAEKHGESQQK